MGSFLNGTIDMNSSPDVAVISEKIRLLEARVDELTAKISRLEIGSVPPAHLGPVETVPALFPMESSEGLGEWIRKGALLQKTAIVCFILVFALLLRTVADYGYVNALAGSGLGLAYVSLLAITGIVFYVTGKAMANVFAISGFLLLFAIVFEGYGRFGTVPLGVAYAILLTALLTSAAVGIKYRAAKLLSVSLVGVAFSSLAIGFPRLHFPLSGLLFLAVNGVVIIATARLASGKLRWPITILTLLFWALWAFKAQVPISRGEPVPDYIYPAWFALLLIVFVALYFLTYVRRYFSEVRLTVYDAVMPSFNVLLLLLAGNVACQGYWQQPWLFGGSALTMGFIHFAVGWRLSVHDRGRFVGVGGAFVAGAIALALGVPVVVGNVAWAIFFWALLAYGLALLSGRCESGVIRAVSYLYQIFALLTGLALGVFAGEPAAVSSAALTAAAALALFGLIQFKWCRRNPPPPGTLFAKLDRRNNSAVVLLLIGLAGLYLLLNLIINLSASLVLADPVNTIRCGRSIVINLGATLLLMAGGRRHDAELVWIAVLLAVIGGLKVFLVDLFGGSGLPLVLSVLSFGVVAMVGSMVMGRWTKPLKDKVVC